MTKNRDEIIERLIQERGSLLDHFPDAAKDWGYEENGDLTPDKVLPYSKQKVYWLCPKCKRAFPRIISRAVIKNHCPFCTEYRLIPGKNDLATRCPDAAKDWDYEANGALRPEMVQPKSNKIVVWKCEKGHSFKMQIYYKTSGYACSVCNNRQLHQGVNDLLTLFPEAIEELHPTLNGEINPEKILAYTDEKFWFVCPDEGCIFLRPLAGKTRHNYRCPKCTNFGMYAQIDNLAKRFPRIAGELHPNRNGDVDPNDVIPYSEETLWWEHKDCGCEYPMRVCDKVRFGPGCVKCGTHMVVLGVNDLASQYPEIAKELQPDKKYPMTAEELAVRAYIKVCWKCKVCGRKYRATVRTRTKGDDCCPRCNQRRAESLKRMANDRPLREAVERWHREMPYLGVRKIVVKLAQEGLDTSVPCVERLMKEMQLCTVYPKKRRKRKKWQCNRIYSPYLLRKKEIFMPNQVWSIDISFFKTVFGKMYLIAIIDWHSQFIVGWEVGVSQRTAIILQMLENSLNEHGMPGILNSDKGIQFTSKDYTRFLKDRRIRQSMNGRGQWTDNWVIEGWFSRVKSEIPHIKDCENFEDFRSEIAKYVFDYNHRRPNGRLKDAVPAQVYGEGFEAEKC